MFDLVIYNGVIVNSSTIIYPPSYIGIKNEKIACISTEPLTGTRSIDAKGGFITPGGIDAHVHVSQPCTSDTFDSATRSSICGGTTSFVCFATQERGVKSAIPDLKNYLALADGKCYCDYAMHMIVTDPTPTFLEEEMPIIVKDYGITSVKVYMTYKIWSVNDKQILQVLIMGRKLGVTTMIHAENNDVIEFLIDKFEKTGQTEPYFHAASRPFICEDEASYRAISLANTVDQALLIVHMSTKESMAHVRKAQTKNCPIYSETCPQYLFLTSEYLKSHTHEHKTTPVIDDGYEIEVSQNDSFQGAKYICSPPIRETQDELEGVWQAIENGTVTVYSSDHSPCNYDDKEGKKKGLKEDGSMDFAVVPNGLPGVETRLPLLFCYGVETGRISPQRFVEVSSTNPAALYGMSSFKGSIDIGLDADLVIWYPKGEMKPFKLTNEMLHHDIDHTPFAGMTFTNWPRYSILRGKVVWDRDNGGLKEVVPEGKYLKRGRSTMTMKRSEVPPKYFY
ncbi:DEKNAAC100991 [Brettanomyces naardenensis]|uniref:dihydropyrimidinase n=1 Tax=Brettanomyces naardenensis TaxID=13370 RepID=A0A448YGP2_BRENA|nr:DEKNAAC100991 [Brettanomyces naardenensis]